LVEDFWLFGLGTFSPKIRFLRFGLEELMKKTELCQTCWHVTNITGFMEYRQAFSGP
jgi:hypothetical protein